MADKTCYFAVTGALVLILLPIVAVQGQDDNCLGCLCEASSNCTASIGCTTPYPGGYFCGPFSMSRGYWVDAGKPILGGDNPGRDGAFENCANDVHCAADAVINYMKKFRQDCNADGIVDCIDFAFIHVLGGYGCRDPAFVTTGYFLRFLECSKVLTAASAQN